jgi:spore coat polysaccharide biosynthesis protein SpsF
MLPIILQARMSSSRLSGKMMRLIGGRPLMDRVVERCRLSAEASSVIVATSSDASDDALAGRCGAIGAECFRGDLADVAARVAGVIAAKKAEAFVRICGDSPFIDPELIDRAIRAFRSMKPDLVTNTFPRSFPKGESVEVIRAAAFLSATERMTEPDEREHVTAVFYRRPGDYRIHNFSHSENLSAENLCVDTPEDLARMDGVFKELGERAARCGWEEALAAAREIRVR